MFSVTARVLHIEQFIGGLCSHFLIIKSNEILNGEFQRYSSNSKNVLNVVLHHMKDINLRRYLFKFIIFLSLNFYTVFKLYVIFRKTFPMLVNV